MTKKQIDKMIEDIKTATTEACKSKESAIEFLTKAGIMKKKKKFDKH